MITALQSIVQNYTLDLGRACLLCLSLGQPLCLSCHWPQLLTASDFTLCALLRGPWWARGFLSLQPLQPHNMLPLVGGHCRGRVLRSLSPQQPLTGHSLVHPRQGGCRERSPVSLSLCSNPSQVAVHWCLSNGLLRKGSRVSPPETAPTRTHHGTAWVVRLQGQGSGVSSPRQQPGPGCATAQPTCRGWG